MQSAILYVLTVLIWGTTWIAIKLQLSTVAVEASIIYRFMLAGITLFIILGITRKLQSLSWRDHGFCLLQGICLFNLNFYCFYNASFHIPSGLNAVVMSLASVFNCINLWIFFRQRPSIQMVSGSLLGITGICMMFWPEITLSTDPDETLTGIAFATTGTILFSLANMLSIRHQQNGLRPPTTNAWGMLYGSLTLAIIAAIQRVPFTFDSNTNYIASLIYLAIPGSVIGFTAYLMLVGRIGADKAAYCTVLFPAVALTISTFAEGYQWTNAAVGGFALIIMGNIIIFARKRTSD